MLRTASALKRIGVRWAPQNAAVFGISIFRCYDPIDHAGDYLGFIMLVGYKTIRKLVVMSVAFRAAEPADHKILFHAAFLLPDT